MWYEITVCKTYLENDGIKRSYYDKLKTGDYELLRKVLCLFLKHYESFDFCHVSIEVEKYNYDKHSIIFDWQNKEIEDEI